MNVINWGVFGVGGIASRRTLPGVVAGAPSSRFIWAMDTRAEAAQQAAQQFHIPQHGTSTEAVLADPEVQAIYIATPVAAHAEQIVTAAHAGKHVFVEKPLTLTIAEGKQVLATCADAGVLLGCGYMMRFHALHIAAKELVARGELGRVVAGRAQLTCWYPPIPGAWRQDPIQGGGGSLMDMGSHCIDLLEYITDSKVTSVVAMNQNLVQAYPSEDTSTIILRLENGAQMIVDSLFNVPDEASRSLLELYGTKGALYGEGTVGQMPTGRITVMLSDQGSYDAQQERTPSTRVFDLKAEPINMYAAEIEHFSQAILTGGQPAVDGAEALWNLHVVDACYRASCEGREIHI